MAEPFGNQMGSGCLGGQPHLQLLCLLFDEDGDDHERTRHDPLFYKPGTGTSFFL